MHEQMYSLGEVARILGVAPFRITYAIAVGLVPDTAIRFAGKRVFSTTDLTRFVEHFQPSRADFGQTTEIEIDQFIEKGGGATS